LIAGEDVLAGELFDPLDELALVTAGFELDSHALTSLDCLSNDK
jgi:hypothetical protein